jgi:pimeloyl-ACP methyl ester carboxylesterase
MKRSSGVALMGAVALAGTLVAVLPALADEPKKQELTWAACPADVVVPPLVLIPPQCATIKVPLDYSDPDGTQIDLMISRTASTDPAKRRGILMFNPGGPGGTGLDQPAFLAGRGLPTSVMDSYDLIGMDTRGVGHSSKASCGFVVGDPYYGNIPPFAVDDAAVTGQAAIAKDVAERCAANDKDGRLPHLTTANTARDLDRIRAALGEPKASFYGASYGTALGAAYASMFPETADRVVLDSNVGDTHLDQAGMRRFGLGFEQTFTDFAKWVAARDDSYGLGRTPEQVRRTFIATGFFNESLYGNLARLWQGWRKPAANPVAAQKANMSEPAAAPKADTPSPTDTNLTVFLAVTCNDVNWPEDLDTYRKAVAEDRKRLPLYGPAAANINPCAYWKWEPKEPPVKINDSGPANILILQNRLDPATPYAGGKLLRDKFAKRSKLVSVNASGHGVYVLGGNACALNATTNYLVDGEMPKRDLLCKAA